MRYQQYSQNNHGYPLIKRFPVSSAKTQVQMNIARTSRCQKQFLTNGLRERDTAMGSKVSTRRRPRRESAWPASGSAFITTQGDVELGELYGLVHKLTGHGIIGGASNRQRYMFSAKNQNCNQKIGPRFYQRIIKNLETISAVQTIVKMLNC